MTKRISFIVLLSLLFLIQACQNSPMTPSTTNAKVMSISVTSPRHVTTFSVGDSETFTATAILWDGRKQTITSGTWSSGNPSIASVNSSGLVTIVGVGTADIIMAYGGTTGSLSINGREGDGVVPDYQGTWTGTYNIDGCSASGDFSTNGFCGTFTGSGYPIDLILTQDINDVQGTVQLGSFSSTFLAFLDRDGKLRLECGIPADPYVIDVATEFQLTGSGQMTGTMSLTYTAAGWTGSGQLVCTITSLSRTSTTANAKALAGGQPVRIGTLAELINALRRH